MTIHEIRVTKKGPKKLYNGRPITEHKTIAALCFVVGIIQIALGIYAAASDPSAGFILKLATFTLVLGGIVSMFGSGYFSSIIRLLEDGRWPNNSDMPM